MIFDSDGKGLETIYKPYQVEAMRYIMAARQPVNTRQVHEALLARGASSNHGGLSRASVINFLAAQAEEGLLTLGDATGKGGHQALYSKNVNSADEATLKNVLRMRLVAAVEEELA